MAEPSFEDLYKQLEEKAARLDDGKLPLEESIKVGDMLDDVPERDSVEPAGAE